MKRIKIAIAIMHHWAFIFWLIILIQIKQKKKLKRPISSYFLILMKIPLIR